MKMQCSKWIAIKYLFPILLLLTYMGMANANSFFPHAQSKLSFPALQNEIIQQISANSNLQDKIALQYQLASLYLTYERIDLLAPLLSRLEQTLENETNILNRTKWYLFNGYALYYQTKYGMANDSFKRAFNEMLRVPDEVLQLKESQYLLTVLQLYSSLNLAYLQQYSDATFQLSEINVTAKALDWPIIYGLSFYFLGMVSYEIKNYEQALEYYHQAQLAFPPEAEHFKALALLTEAQMINIVGDRREAFERLDQSLKTLQNYQDLSSLAFGYLLKSYFYSKDNNYPLSLVWISKSVELREKIGTSANIANAYVHYSGTLFDNGQLEKALEYAEKASNIVKDTDDLSGKWDAFGNYAHLLSEKGDYQQAYEYMHQSERALLAKARLDITAETARLNTEFNLQKEKLNNQYLDEKNDLLQRELEKEQLLQSRQNSTIWMLSVSTLFTLVSLSIIYRLYLTNKKLASKDSLTGLPNRRTIFEIGERLFSLSKRYKHDMCVLMIDIDNFKQINDTHGHGVGDKALKFLTEVFTGVLRKSDSIGRVGGEEFLMVLPHSNEEDGYKLAQRLMEETQRKFPESNLAIDELTFSVGLANHNLSYNKFEDLYKAADDALYKAKHNGRNQIQAVDENHSIGMPSFAS
ncbi:diguanylate cyclase [Glaciecola sp. 1036]|uniref:GGDEF domain-containing protein n=1 Tax=Alteromonadaceae TaxID=72275 RepID=UPI003D0629EF